MTETGEDRLVEAIYDALDRGEPEAALELAGNALSDQDDPVLRFLAGVALMEMDLAGEAVEQLSRSVEMDPDDAEFRAHLALALFRLCRFEEGLGEARRAVEAEAGMPDALAALGLLLEREGRFREADEHLVRAGRLDPERFPPPFRMTRPAFEEVVRSAGERLPERFRSVLEEVAVTVEDLPSEEILREESPPLDPELLGLFVGVALSERSHLGPGGELPPRILLFQRNLERFARDADTLQDEIAVTLYHELGHYLGMDEEELHDLDLG